MDGSKPDYIFATRTLYHTMEKKAIILCVLTSIFYEKIWTFVREKSVLFNKTDKSLQY